MGEECTLSPEDSHYLKNVLRLPVAAPVVLVDTAHSVEFESFITSFNEAGLVIVKATSVSQKTEYVSGVGVLLCALCKLDASELIVEKATELGVSVILFFQSERSIARIADQKDREKKIERFKKIADSAVRQSARLSIPKIEIAASLGEALELINHMVEIKTRLVAALTPESLSIASVLGTSGRSNHPQIVIAVGPEGDFSGKEYEVLFGSGFKPITLGGNRLRAETAVIAAIAGIDAVLGAQA